MGISLVIALMAICAILTWLWLRPSNSSLPPGPRGLPILGNVLQIVKDPHLKLSEWAKEFGNIYTIYLAHKPMLVVSEVTLMKELLSHPNSTGKFKTDTLLVVTGGAYGIVSTEGKQWEEQRKVADRILARHGFKGGRGDTESVDTIFMSQLQEFNEVVAAEMERSHVLSLTELIGTLAVNALTAFGTYEMTSIHDASVAKSLDELLLIVERTQRTGLMYLPWLKHIAPVATGFKALNEHSKKFHDMVKNMYKEYRTTHIPGLPRGLIDSYIDHMDSVADPNSGFYGETGEKNVYSSTFEVYIAGARTTSLTMEWLLLYLIHNKDAQRKLHSEIDAIVGKDRDPDLVDKSRMPYTEAVILETLRHSSLVGLGLIHEVLDDMPFQGYVLPKGTLLTTNAYHAHHDTKVWTNPEKFQPERFLNESQTAAINRNKIVPFQIGKRVCPGEGIAKSILFLFTTKFFQRFEILPDPDQAEPNLKAEVGVLSKPPVYKVALKIRN